MRAPLFLLGFAVTVAFWPGLVSAALAPRWAALAVGAPLCLMLTTCQGDEHAPDGGRGLLLLLAFVLLSGASASVFWTPDILTGLNEVAHLAILLTVFYLGAMAEDLSPAWFGIAAGVTVSAAIAIAQSLGWEAIAQTAAPAGLFVNKNFLAETGVVALVAMIGARAWWWIPGPAVGALLPVSKGALGALALIGAIALYRRHPYLAMSLGTAVLLLAALAFAWPLSTAAQRIDLWSTALGDLRWFGHGAGSFQVTYPFAEFAHSEPVQFAYELGLLGIPFAAVLLYALGPLGAPFAAGGAHEVEWFILLAIAAIGLLSFPLRLPVTGFAAALAAGHLVAGRLRLRALQPARRVTPGIRFRRAPPVYG